MPDEEVPASSDNLELLYPMYLDTDMSMAFAAALAGGIALEQETVERDSHESSAVRNLRGNLRLFDVVGVGGGRSTTDADASGTEARMTRRHTEASIFIALHDELRRRGRIREATVPGVQPGELVAMELGPATAPFRRVIEQLLRLFDLAAPAMPQQRPAKQQRRPQGGRGQSSRQQSGAAATAPEPASGEWDLNTIRSLLKAMEGDLDHSGMTDIVVRREEAPSVILTLDNRFVATQTLELLHTSTFTVIGKVTQVWPTDQDIANLYRRSVVSLVPALSQAVGWMFLTMMGGLAAAIDVSALQRQAVEALNAEPEAIEQVQQEIMFGEDFQALLPTVSGPAIQILPLAICA